MLKKNSNPKDIDNQCSVTKNKKTEKYLYLRGFEVLFRFL